MIPYHVYDPEAERIKRIKNTACVIMVTAAIAFSLGVINGSKIAPKVDPTNPTYLIRGVDLSYSEAYTLYQELRQEFENDR